jgi:hypothetical protein
MPFRYRLVRTVIALVVCSAAPLVHAQPSCDAPDPCAARACRLDAEIAQASAKGNRSELARLERARGEMAHCSDDGLKQKRKVALDRAQQRIDQRAAELRKVEASGDTAKINKAQRKLDSARKAYSEIESSPL